MNLILLTVKSRNGKLVNKQMLIDVDDIATPLKKTGAGGNDTTFSLREGKKGPFAHFNTGTALTTYIVDETLTQINAAANEIFVANVFSYKGREVVGTPEMGFNMKFIAGYIERNTANTLSFFKYQEDSDPGLVDYEVTQTLSQITAQLNTQFVESVTGPNVDNTDPWNPIVNDGSIPIPILYADFIIAYNALTLTAGRYLITDRADHGIVVNVFEDSKGHIVVGKNAEGVFLNPDFQSVGVYSGVFAYTGVIFAGTAGVWNAAGEAGTADGDVVFWNGFHYQVINQTLFAGTNPLVNVAAYTLLPKDGATDGTLFGYIEETDNIEYDVITDTILMRADVRGNIIRNNIMPIVGAPFAFQWGNNSVSSNVTTSQSGAFNIINQRGQMYSNTVTNGTITVSQFQTGTIELNRLHVLQLQLDGDGTFSRNTMDYLANMVVDMDDYTYVNKVVNNNESTFFKIIDMTTFFAAGVLTLQGTNPDELYIGIYLLDGTSGANISSILTLPTGRDVEFRARTAGETYTFTHTAIGAAVANQLVSDAAAANVITGRTNGTDYITYRKTGTLNQRTDAAIMA